MEEAEKIYFKKEDADCVPTQKQVRILSGETLRSKTECAWVDIADWTRIAGHNPSVLGYPESQLQMARQGDAKVLLHIVI